jgi:hypothetical protein
VRDGTRFSSIETTKTPLIDAYFPRIYTER